MPRKQGDEGLWVDHVGVVLVERAQKPRGAALGHLLRQLCAVDAGFA